MIKNDNLPYYSIGGISRTYQWERGEENKYQKLQKKYGKNWYYYNSVDDPIIVETNEFGYRSRTIYPCNEYYLMLGCSVTFGQYLHLRDLAASILEKELGVPIINLGIPGGSSNAMSANVQKLMMSGYPKPKAIFAQWPVLQRYGIFGRSKYFYVNAQKEKFIFKKLIVEREIFETVGKNAFFYINSLNIPVINYSLFQDNNYKFYDIPYIDKFDQARDDCHPGPLTNRKITDYILSKMKTV